MAEAPSAWRTHCRSVSAAQPIYSAPDRIAAHCESGFCLSQRAGTDVKRRFISNL